MALLLGSILLFALSAWLAADKILVSWERSLLLSLYNLPEPLKFPGFIITQFGSAWMLTLISLGLLLGKSRSQHIGRLVFGSGVIAYILIVIAKHLIGRPRPIELVAGLTQRDIFITGFGFPSGHTALATIISLTLLPFLPRRWRWLPLVWIGLVGISRVYLGVHAPLDIIGGFAIGLGVIAAERLLKVR